MQDRQEQLAQIYHDLRVYLKQQGMEEPIVCGDGAAGMDVHAGRSAGCGRSAGRPAVCGKSRKEFGCISAADRH